MMRGKNAGIFRESEKWTDEGRAKMTDQISRFYYDDFGSKGRARQKQNARRS